MALNSVTFSDLDISFGVHPVTGDLLKKTGPNAIVQSILNLIQTNHFERPFHPEIGGNLRRLLFELADSVTANLLAEEIKDVIGNFEPRAQVINVYVVADIDGNGYNVTVESALQNLATPVSISTFLQRIR